MVIFLAYYELILHGNGTQTGKAKQKKKAEQAGIASKQTYNKLIPLKRIHFLFLILMS